LSRVLSTFIKLILYRIVVTLNAQSAVKP